MLRPTILRTALIAAIAAPFCAHSQTGLREITVTASAGERQTFQGLGGSLKGGWSHGYSKLSPERRDRVADLLWSEAKLNTIRVWMIMSRYAPQSGVRDLAVDFPEALADQIRNAQQRGVKHLVLAPCGVPDYLKAKAPTEPLPEGKVFNKTEVADDMRAEHAAILADYLKAVKETYGIEFTATGIQNEPNTSHDSHFTAQQMVDSVKLLRKALDARGLQSVKIVAPETASCDHVAYSMVDALKADPEAWQALAGVATHSYNMAATGEMYGRIRNESKEYWQTESSAPGKEEVGDADRAAKAASTFLSDLNNGVTHWLYFIAAAGVDPRDNGTRILAYNAAVPEGEDGWLITFQKYFYLKQLALTFQPGSKPRRCTSTLDKSMTWTYGLKPRVTVAVAANPDGSWGIGISNYTTDAKTTRQFDIDNSGYPAESFTVHVYVEELRDSGKMLFAVERCGPGNDAESEPPVTMEDGHLTVTIHPCELICLRAK